MHVVVHASIGRWTCAKGWVHGWRLLLLAAVVLGAATPAWSGYPLTEFTVSTPEGSCPTKAPPMKAGSWVSGFTGSLEDDIVIPDKRGGSLTLHYSSGADNPGTHGTRLLLNIRQEKRAGSPYLVHALAGARVAFSSSNGSQDSIYAAPGLDFHDPAYPDGEGAVCNPVRENSSIPYSGSSIPTTDLADYDPADSPSVCVNGGSHAQGGWDFTLTMPFVASGSFPMSKRNASPDCGILP